MLKSVAFTLACAVLVLACNSGSSSATGSQPAPSGSAQPARTLYVSAIPDENPTELIRKYEPLVRHLETTLGSKVKYVPVTDYGAAVSALAAGKVDFAWLGAFTHVQARHQTEVVPLCMRAVDREFKSVFLASADAGIGKMADLSGKTFAFGSKSSTSGHLMPRHYLTTQHQLDPSKAFDGAPVFSGSHDATIVMIQSGKVQAGVANRLVWQRMLRDKQVDSAKVKVIWTTPGYVDYVWTARKAVPEALRKKFINAFVQLDKSKPNDAKVLALQDAQSFVVASPSDFDAVEKVALSTGLLKARK